MITATFFQAIDNVKENFTTTLSGMLTVCFSLIILGTFTLIYQNLILLSQQFFQESHYSIFLDEKTKALDQYRIQSHLEGLWGFEKLEVISPEQAKIDLIQSFGEAGKLLEKMQFQRLPGVIEFSLQRPDILTPRELKNIEKLEGVGEVIYGRETRDQIETFFLIANFVGIFLIVLFLISVIFTIRASIQVAVRLRIKEIEILRILGATMNFICWPYIWEGIFIAFSSFILSTGGIYFVFQFIIAGITFNEATYKIRTAVHFFSPLQLGLALLLIVVLGVFSSLSATNKILKQLDS
ncbi:MAG: hypothetical protein COB67_05590 [SAR324 cluster bacterium]|uniref:Cell division protein FtsX n=1 Tax=SAR324 cluster bacterium TaxID=2024889 RepID=A0A2A4T5H0_9DELT|nr:MAG: hypothetical protein COB67_05590 [SAR324 cluster bacterium]